MIVPAMSNKEMKTEIMTDVNTVFKKFTFTEREVDRMLIKTKGYPFIKAFDYVTPKTKNTWIYIIEKQTKKHTYFILLNYHYTDKGLRVGLVTTEMDVIFLNGHLFSRYVLREKTPITNPIDKIKEFFIKNPMIMHEREMDKSGINKLIGKVNTGVVLGVETREGFNIYNTYVNNDLLRKDQSILAESLQAELDLYFKEKPAEKWVTKSKKKRG